MSQELQEFLKSEEYYTLVAKTANKIANILNTNFEKALKAENVYMDSDNINDEEDAFDKFIKNVLNQV